VIRPRQAKRVAEHLSVTGALPAPFTNASTAMPPADPASPATWRSPAGPPARSWPPAGTPLRRRNEIWRGSCWDGIKSERHRFDCLNQLEADCANSRGGRRVLCKAEKGASRRSAHRLLLCCRTILCTRLKCIERVVALVGTTATGGPIITAGSDADIRQNPERRTGLSHVRMNDPAMEHRSRGRGRPQEKARFGCPPVYCGCPPSLTGR
jgi:hypothetical protein